MTKRNGLGKFVRALDLVELFFDSLPKLKIVTVFQNEERLINQKMVCPAAPLKPLVSAAYSRNIDFKIGDNVFDCILNIKHISSVVKFILANEVDMLPGNGGKSEYNFCHFRNFSLPTGSCSGLQT